MARVRRVIVRGAVHDRIHIASARISRVGCICVIPCLCIHSTLLLVRRTILEQHIGIEKDARQRGSIGRWVLGVIGCGVVARCRAQARVEGTRVESAAAKECVLVVAIERCVDGSGVKIRGSDIVWCSARGKAHITVGASDGNFEA